MATVDIPAGWERTSQYSIGRGKQSICLVTVCGEKRWELWTGTPGKSSDNKLAHSVKHADGGYQECLKRANEMTREKR